MNPKKTQLKWSLSACSRFSSTSGDHLAKAKRVPTLYFIDSVEMDVSLVSATGSTPPEAARMIVVTDTATVRVMVATAHFEPDYDLVSAGGAAGYDPSQHAAAEIQHFRALFPGLTN